LKSPNGSTRYVIAKDGNIYGALQVMSRDGKEGTISNVMVLPEYRRQGVATELFNMAKKDFKALKHSNDLTSDGASFANSTYNQSSVSDPQGDLVAIHNPDAGNIDFAASFGGLPVPSIAITKKNISLTGYGDITLIGNKEMIDPSKTPVFSTDAYTMRFPPVVWPKVPTKIVQTFVNKYRHYFKEVDKSVYLDQVWDYMTNNPDRDKAITSFKAAGGILAFIREVKGMDYAVPMQNKAVESIYLQDPGFVEYLKSIGDDIYNMKDNDPRWAEISNKAKEALSNIFTKKIEAGAARDLTASFLKKDFNEEGNMYYGPFSRMSMDIDKVGKKEIDAHTARKDLEKMVEPYAEEFNKWAADLFAPMFTNPQIKVGKKNVPLNLNNVVEAMTSAKVKSKESTMTYGPGQLKAAVSRRFKSLDDLLANKDRLISPQEESVANKDLDALLEKFRNVASASYLNKNWRGEVDIWNAFDDSMKSLAAAQKKGGTIAAVKAALKKNDFDAVDNEVAQVGVDALKKIAEGLTDYFEAKPQRAVALSEFSGAVIPADTPASTRKNLEAAGVSMVEYDPKVEGSRQAAIESFYDKPNILFQSAAWHGTPHSFDKFSLDHLGSGEGAQAFGWGLYFAGDRKIAEWYKKTLSGPDAYQRAMRNYNSKNRQLSVNNWRSFVNQHPKEAGDFVYDIEDYANGRLTEEELGNELSNVFYYADKGKDQYVSEDVANFILENVKLQQKDSKMPNPKDYEDSKGKLYEVSLKPDAEEFLNWDVPLSEQSEKVKTSLNEMREMFGYGEDESVTGKDLYRNIMSDLMRGNFIPENEDPQKTVSILLHDFGIPGIRYLDGTSRQSGEGSHNYVVFNDEAIEIVNTYEQAKKKKTGAVGKRGSIEFSPNGGSIISLFAAADRSTFLHETGHLFLADMENIALGTDAPAAVKADFETTKAYLGVTQDQIGPDGKVRWTVAQHETYARTFEAYLIDGKAPSTKLQKVFQNFKRWLVSIYRNVKGLNVDITQDIREVMDRMLATEGEIKQAESFSEYKALLDEEAGKGISFADYNKYLELMAEARGMAEETLLSKLMVEVSDERKAALAEKRTEVFLKVSEEVRNMPVYKTLEFLANSQESGVILGTEALIDQFGEDVVASLPPEIHSRDSDLSADDVADIVMFYTSGDEMIQTILAARPMDQEIEDQVGYEMDAVNVSALDNGQVKQMALDSIHNTKRLDMMALEVSMLDLLIEQGNLNSSARILANKEMVKALKEVAKNLVNDHVVYLVKNSKMGVETKGAVVDDEGNMTGEFYAGFSNNEPWYADILGIINREGLPSNWATFINDFKAGKKPIEKMPAKMREVYSAVAEDQLKNGFDTTMGPVPEDPNYSAILAAIDESSNIDTTNNQQQVDPAPVTPEQAVQMALDLQVSRKERLAGALAKSRAIKAAAKSIIANKTYIEAIKASEYFTAERRAATKAEAAYKDGNYIKAANACAVRTGPMRSAKLKAPNG